MTRVLMIAASALLLAPAAASAQTPAVDSARTAGVVGERFDGYLGFAAEPTAAVRSQTGAINIKRRALYANLAAAKGATVQDVGITAGCTLLARVAVGGAYMLADGVWRRRGPAEAPALPSYCR